MMAEAEFPPVMPGVRGDDDFNPEDVFKLFPTAVLPDPVRENDVPVTTSSPVAVTQVPVVMTTGENYSFNPNDTWIFGEAEDRIILPMLLSMIGACALFGNLLVIIVILAFRRMRTGPNLMLLNIAVSDLIFMFFSLPTSIINHALLGGVTDTNGIHICKFVHYIIFVCDYVSVYTLVVTCVFRFCTDCTGKRGPGTLLSRGNALISSLVIWLAFIVSHLNFLVQKDGAIFQEPFICVHTMTLPDQTKVKTLWLTFLTCAFLLPLLIVIILSAAILRSQNDYRKPRNHSVYESAQNDANERRNTRELTMVVMASMVARVLCWLPIQIFIMIDIFGMTEMSELYRKAEMLGVCIAFMGCAINPLVYNCVSSNFKQAFSDLLAKCCCKTPRGQPQKPNSDASGSDMNETIMSIIADSSNHINYC